MTPVLPNSGEAIMVESEQPRPEVALRSAPSPESRRARELGNVLPRYHALNSEEPWLTACGYTIDGDSPVPLGAGHLTCQLWACRRILEHADV